TLTSPNLDYLQPPLLLHNNRGNFTRVPPATAGAAFGKPKASRGAAFGDLDNDGRIDVVISNVGQEPTILRNTSKASNHWLAMRLEGTRANRDGIGCRVKITMPSGKLQVYEVNTAAGYLSANDRRLLIGLGEAAVVPRIDIRWPGGRVQTLTE